MQESHILTIIGTTLDSGLPYFLVEKDWNRINKLLSGTSVLGSFVHEIQLRQCRAHKDTF